MNELIGEGDMVVAIVSFITGRTRRSRAQVPND